MRTPLLLIFPVLACGGGVESPESRTLLVTVDAVSRLSVDAVRMTETNGGSVYRFTEDLGATTIPPARTFRGVYPPDRPRAVAIHVEALFEGAVVAAGRGEGFLGGAPAYILLDRRIDPVGDDLRADLPDLRNQPDMSTPPLDLGTLPDGAASPDLLAASDGAATDEAAPADLAVAPSDLVQPDLAQPDLTQPDLGRIDLAQPDLYPPPPDLKLYSKCGQPGDGRDSGGIGGYCGPGATKPCEGNSWCSTGSTAPALRDRYFCTAQCSRDGGKTLDGPCGGNSACWCPQGSLDCFCLPLYCAP